MSRELHDELGQYINVIKIDAVSIRDEDSLERNCIVARAQLIVDHCNHVHDALQDAHAITLYRLVQEALTNVAKHSMATRASVQIERTRPAGASHDLVTVTVSDDGHGADLSLPTRGLGLMGMRERIAALAGEFELSSLPKGGFQLIARLPVSRGEMLLECRDGAAAADAITRIRVLS